MLWSRCGSQDVTLIPRVANFPAAVEEAKLLSCRGAGWEGVLRMTSHVSMSTGQRPGARTSSHSFPTPFLLHAPKGVSQDHCRTKLRLPDLQHTFLI